MGVSRSSPLHDALVHGQDDRCEDIKDSRSARSRLSENDARTGVAEVVKVSVEGGVRKESSSRLERGLEERRRLRRDTSPVEGLVSSLVRLCREKSGRGESVIGT